MNTPSILVVDDDDSMRKFLAKVLQEQRYSVSVAENGQQAAALLAATTEPPGLILLDLVMPVMDGWQFLEWIQGQRRLDKVPVIAITGFPQAANAMAGLGPVACLSKPFDIPLLLETIAAHCPPPG
jgi:CheY-like chemotaxis protein